MKNKILHFLFITIILISCNKYSRDKYPQLVSKLESYKNINSCYSAELNTLDKIPTDIHNNIKAYFKQRLGDSIFQKLEFKNVNVFSNKPIKIKRNSDDIVSLLGQQKEKEECDTIIAFPVYSATYHLKKPEIGIEKIGLNLMLDKNGKIIKDIQFPTTEVFNKTIPIDSVHSELIRRKIPYKKLSIELWFDKKTKSFIWETNTLVRNGSIFGPSCFPEVKHHFKMNATTGEIIEYDSEKLEEYFTYKY
ncbi:hypothetical protein [Tenacibaculum aiptasiae]|uniref:hypothetical protein n=1 Tax=Tenacibaculum aiptasiae TaxID=426481 RepID=UPI003B5AC65C